MAECFSCMRKRKDAWKKLEKTVGTWKQAVVIGYSFLLGQIPIPDNCNLTKPPQRALKVQVFNFNPFNLGQSFTLLFPHGRYWQISQTSSWHSPFLWELRWQIQTLLTVLLLCNSFLDLFAQRKTPLVQVITHEAQKFSLLFWCVWAQAEITENTVLLLKICSCHSISQ